MGRCWWPVACWSRAHRQTRKGPLSRVELYDPGSGQWRGVALLPTARAQFGATLLTNGQLLLTGGQANDANGRAMPLTVAEI